MYVFRVIEPISRIMDFVDTISEETAMAENYDKIVSYVNKCAPDGQIEMDSFNNSIELRNVRSWLSYRLISFRIQGH